MVVMGNFPNWPEVVPIPNLERTKVPEALLENVTRKTSFGSGTQILNLNYEN